jgi:hypothetical protein
MRYKTCLASWKISTEVRRRISAYYSIIGETRRPMIGRSVTGRSVTGRSVTGRFVDVPFACACYMKQSLPLRISLKTEVTVNSESVKRKCLCLDQGSGNNIACGICELHAKQCRLQYRWELKLKKRRQHLKNILPSENLILAKACPNIHSAKSNLMRW